MANLHFYRIEIFQNQLDALREWPGARSILEAAAENFPKSTGDRRVVHFITQYQRVDDDGCYFQIAKRRKKITEELEGEHFQRREHPDVPHARVLIDFKRSLLVIEKNYNYSTDTDTIAQRIRRWINKGAYGLSPEYKTFVSPIRNPKSLIQEIEQAIIVRKFYFEVKRKNVFDTQQLAKNVKEFTTEINGESTRTETTGSKMDKGLITSIIKSSASTGDDAGALLIPKGSKKYKKYTLGKNLLVSELPEKILENVKTFLSEARKIYDKNRGE